MRTLAAIAAILVALPVCGQTATNNPFPNPIEATEGVIRVNYVEFATLPDVNGEPARAMTLTTEPGTRRMFVSDMRSLLYSLSYDGRTITPYLDFNDPRWGHPVQAQGRERGVQSFAFHPQFAQNRASAGLSMKAPEPNFTSMTRPWRPAASFFDRIEAVIRSMDSTVAVTSRME